MNLKNQTGGRLFGLSSGCESMVDSIITKLKDVIYINDYIYNNIYGNLNENINNIIELYSDKIIELLSKFNLDDCNTDTKTKEHISKFIKYFCNKIGDDDKFMVIFMTYPELWVNITC